MFEALKNRLIKDQQSIYSFKIIDANVHGNAAEIIKGMRRNNIKKAILLPSDIIMPKQSPRNINLQLSSISRNYLELIAFCIVHPYSKNAIYELEEAVIDMGLKGLFLSPDSQQFDIEDEDFWFLLEKAEELSIPVMLYTNYSPEIDNYFNVEALKEVISSFKINFILSHFGSGDNISEIVSIADLKNVFFETSHLSKEAIMHAIEVIGEDKIIFGSDSYSEISKKELEKIISLNTGKKIKDKILYNNIERILKVL